MLAARFPSRNDGKDTGKPQQNAYVERYNRTVRYDRLVHYLFDSIEEVQEFATRWLWTIHGSGKVSDCLLIPIGRGGCGITVHIKWGSIEPEKKKAELDNSAS